MSTGNDHKNIELSYLSQQLCVLLKVSRRTYVELDPATLENLVGRVKKKLDAVKAAGRIQRYNVDPEKLKRIWPKLKKMLDASQPDEQFAIRFAFGIKSFSNIHISAADSDDKFCEITITAPAAEIDQWNIIALANFIKEYVKQQGWSDGTPDLHNLKEICKRAQHRPGTAEEVAMGQESDEAEIVKVVSTTTAPKPTVAKASSPAQNQAAGPTLTIKAEFDGLSARIADFKMRWYDSVKQQLDDQWLISIVKSQGFDPSNSEEFLSRIKQKIDRRQDLNGLQIVAGVPGTPGKTPYIAPVTAKASEDGLIIPAFNTCEAGAIVAEIRYRVPSIPGKDVYGMAIEAEPVEKLDVELGEGIEKAGPTQFRATFNGLLKIEGNKISLLKTVVHEGDLTVNAGAINFKGNISITGNVETGASITAHGDITIEGSIRGGTVICHGNLIVKGGISTDRTSIHCDGECKASFIERATMYVKGNLTVENAIVQSTIYCGGDITITGSEGRVGASTVFSWGTLSTTKLGFATGASTEIHLGEDWKEARRLRTWQARFHKLTEKLERDRAEERTIAKLKPSQLTKKRAEQREQLKEHITRIDGLAKQLEGRISSLTAGRKFNSGAELKTVFAPDGDVKILKAGEPVVPVAPAA